MQAHVQERIVASTVGRKILAQTGLALQQRLVFGMRGNDIGDLRLERLQRLAFTPLAPGLAIRGAQRTAALVGEQGHGGVFSLYSHQRAIGQCGQSGTRALQT